METGNQNSDAIIRRRHQHFKVLFLVTLETIVAALFLIWSKEVLEFLRCGINLPYCIVPIRFNWHGVHCYPLLKTAVLTIICNLLVIYGLTNSKMLYLHILHIGAFQHAIASIYYSITGLWFAIDILTGKAVYSANGLVVLIGLGGWFILVLENMQKQVENMKNKSTSDTQMV